MPQTTREKAIEELEREQYARYRGLPWERQPESIFGPKPESEEAYSYFQAYRDLGERRSLESVHQLITGAPSLRRLKALSSKNKWTERALLFDKEQDRRFRELQSSRLGIEREARIMAARNLRDIVAELNRQLGLRLAKMRKEKKLLATSTLLRMMNVGARALQIAIVIERRETGEDEAGQGDIRTITDLITELAAIAPDAGS
jgi:hypothetical protein